MTVENEKLLASLWIEYYKHELTGARKSLSRRPPVLTEKYAEWLCGCKYINPETFGGAHMERCATHP